MSELGDEVRALLDEITDERIAHVPDRESRLEIIKVVVRSLLVLGRSERAVERIRQVAAETKTDLDIASDEFRRSFLLRDSDDWLGLAAMAGGEALVREIYPVFRRTPLAAAQPGADEVFITPLLGRHRATVLVSAGGAVEVIAVARAHDIARVLHALHAHASKDIAAYSKNIETEPRWRELLERLVGMLGNDRLREAARGKHVHVFAGGSAVHVPWSAIFVMIAVDVKSVVARLVGVKAGVAGPPSPGTAAVHNGFASGEHWDKALKDLAVSNGAAELKPSQPPAHLELLLLGAHGERSPFGELSIRPTSGRVPARDFAAGAPSARTVFCGICYAGGGFLSGAGDWESMPALLLARGSERVLANTWPAWDLPATRTAFAQVLQRMRAGSVRVAAEELFDWQTSQRATHPRWWSGWTLWVGEDLGGVTT